MNNCHLKVSFEWNLASIGWCKPMVRLRKGWNDFISAHKSVNEVLGRSNDNYSLICDEDLYRITKDLRNFKVFSEYFGFTSVSKSRKFVLRKHNLTSEQLDEQLTLFHQMLHEEVAGFSVANDKSINAVFDTLEPGSNATRLKNSLEQTFGKQYCDTTEFSSFTSDKDALLKLSRKRGFGHACEELLLLLADKQNVPTKILREVFNKREV